MVTNHDFMVLQGRSPLAFSEDIERQTTLEGLAPVSQKALTIIGALLREGARAANIIRIISELNDRVVRQVLEIAERELGPPPMPYCWLALGSEGRKEQTFRTDQDNALVYADPPETEREEAAAYFTRFAPFMRDGLVHCGFEACPADCMASNPRVVPAALRVEGLLLGLDLRADARRPCSIPRSSSTSGLWHGDESLAWELREHLDRLIPEYPAFLGFLANMLVQEPAPHRLLRGRGRGARAASTRTA